MLYGAEFAVCSEINSKQINTVWAECIILNCYTCCCTKPVGFKRLMSSLDIFSLLCFILNKTYILETNTLLCYPIVCVILLKIIIRNIPSRIK